MYIYNGRKLKRTVHILGANGKTLCKAENGNAKLTDVSETVPEGRQVCGICALKQRQPRKTKKRAAIRNGFYSSWEWAEVRYEAFKRYGRKCAVCGSSTNLVADHIKPRALYPELQLDINNLQILCSLCNRGKGRRDETDWRDEEAEHIDADQAAHMRSILQ